MKTKIAEVQDYFKNKLLAGDFEITEITNYLCKIVVDNEYPFTIMVGNIVEFPQITKLYYGDNNFIMIDFNEDESRKLSSVLKTPIREYRKNTLIAEKQAELDKLIRETELE